MEHILLPSQLKHYGSILTYFFKSVQILLRQNNIILESSATFANSACKRLIVHKVQSSLACRLQVCKSHSNLQGLGLRCCCSMNTPYLRKKNPQKIRMRFSRMKHAISEKLYFVYYLRNGVLSSERSPKIRGLQSAECLEDFPLSHTQNSLLPIRRRFERELRT